MHPRHARLRRALLLVSLGALLVTGCDLFRPARLTATPTTAYVDLSVGPPTAVFALRNDGPSRSRLTWSFTSPNLTSYPASGSLAGGAEQDVVVALPVNAVVGTYAGEFTTGDTTLPIIVVTYMGMSCEPELAFAATASASDEILVGYRSGVARDGLTRASASDAATAVVAAAGGTVVRRGLGSEHDLVRAPPGGRDALLDVLRRRPDVAYAVPNAPISRSASPNDPLYDQQWHLSAFGAEQAWAVVDAATPQTEVVVAVIDDGIAVDHPDLAGALLPGWDVFDGDADVRNCTDHGTHVAGIVAAVRGDAFGVAGAASTPWVRVLPVKAWPNTTDATATTTLDAVTRAMRWAAGLSVAGLPANPNPAQVINMSLGTSNEATSTAFAPVIDEAEALGVAVVAAAGNAGAGALDQPAGSATISVGSVDDDYRRSAFSNYGPGLTLMAPGGSASAGSGCPAITSTGIDYLLGTATHTWTCKSGTSMATPYVTAATALLLGLEPGLRDDPVAIAARLKASAERLRPPGYDAETYGAGVLCLDALLTTASVCGVPVAP
jgi:subtilisin family serine protease